MTSFFGYPIKDIHANKITGDVLSSKTMVSNTIKKIQTDIDSIIKGNTELKDLTLNKSPVEQGYILTSDDNKGTAKWILYPNLNTNLISGTFSSQEVWVFDATINLVFQTSTNDKVIYTRIGNVVTLSGEINIYQSALPTTPLSTHFNVYLLLPDTIAPPLLNSDMVCRGILSGYKNYSSEYSDSTNLFNGNIELALSPTPSIHKALNFNVTASSPMVQLETPTLYPLVFTVQYNIQ